MKMHITLNPRLRFGPIVWVLLFLMGIGLSVALIRFAVGIGPISNLGNTYPWGFWISFDLFTGVAIGSGAFTMAAAVYIFELKELRSLVRPSVLTGFIGYIMVIVALLVDLGRPERIWHMIIYQNHTSVLLEIGICVMLYTTVLAVEFAPVFFEGVKWHKPAGWVHRWIMPFIILGVVLSTLHQSSLGSLLLIQPQKLHPLWWTPFLPVMFFISAISIGLAMVIFESSLSARAFGRGLETHLLEKLARAVPYVLGLYLILKFAEIIIAGDAGYLFSSGKMSILFWAEIVLGSLAPLVMFLLPRVRNSPSGQLSGAICLLLGMILNRFNVSWFAISRLNDVFYVPSWMEVSVSVAIFSAGILVFALVAKFLPLFEEEPPHEHLPAVPPVSGD